MDGIPSCNNPRTADGKYTVFRKLFKYTGLILKNLEYNDLGAINAERLKTQMEMEPIDEKEIRNKGYVTYSLLIKFSKKANLTIEKFIRHYHLLSIGTRKNIQNIMCMILRTLKK